MLQTSQKSPSTFCGIFLCMTGFCFADSGQADDKLSATHSALVDAFVENYRTSTPIAPIPACSLTED